ncbi:MAG: hypothetical protein EVJ46_06130 [Candidatus Acididesulfobacter guangdongensis]|uniref:Uncharacterized protein n=1 Tax=Acididesulfobacter guangdongensis TaxID=2597225 RepID=A0A519BH34_ACIG2|nr:MAG: hypothetical protein EVJ46_06130 [Candidatus Acididesulfobacter guangdongensis]
MAKKKKSIERFARELIKECVLCENYELDSCKGTNSDRYEGGYNCTEFNLKLATCRKDYKKKGENNMNEKEKSNTVVVSLQASPRTIKIKGLTPKQYHLINDYVEFKIIKNKEIREINYSDVLFTIIMDVIDTDMKNKEFAEEFEKYTVKKADSELIWDLSEINNNKEDLKMQGISDIVDVETNEEFKTLIKEQCVVNELEFTEEDFKELCKYFKLRLEMVANEIDIEDFFDVEI